MLMMIIVWTVGASFTNYKFMILFKFSFSSCLIKRMNNGRQVVHEIISAINTLEIEKSIIIFIEICKLIILRQKRGLL